LIFDFVYDASVNEWRGRWWVKLKARSNI